ncbi:MAG TPA: tRNA (adenosine(37)-N6)-threonylcarbamoyltransferase complex ATPase subunit type 1 TsaE [Planctomycetaceae bacterium]|nr:tRNA (adenosine(37)-N6)-threonylcarbamoyltransferase complex ATPase subunit type 1 TsaE [Planctomycetaceae bacterium]
MTSGQPLVAFHRHALHPVVHQPTKPNGPHVTPLTYDADSEQQTHRFGLAMGQATPVGLTVALNGPLGAGKTRLVRAIVEGLDGSPQDVSSPTFVLLQHYAARVDVYHADAYRLTSETEFLDLGPEEWLTTPAIVLIEWGERVASSLPEDRIDLEITITGESSRRFELSANGPLSGTLLDNLRDLKSLR